jgi:hypothetical protein
VLLVVVVDATMGAVATGLVYGAQKLWPPQSVLKSGHRPMLAAMFIGCLSNTFGFAQTIANSLSPPASPPSETEVEIRDLVAAHPKMRDLVVGKSQMQHPSDSVMGNKHTAFLLYRLTIDTYHLSYFV